MKVVFIENVPNVAKLGDIKNVANGHARNYLFPKRLAVLATPEELRRVEARKRAEAKLRAEQAHETEALAQVLNGVSLVFAKRISAKGAVYGSVSATAIVQELKHMGYTLEKTMVKLDEPIRQLGTHDVQVDLGKGAVATLKVTIEEAKEEKTAETSAQESAPE